MRFAANIDDPNHLLAGDLKHWIDELMHFVERAAPDCFAGRTHDETRSTIWTWARTNHEARSARFALFDVIEG